MSDKVFELERKWLERLLGNDLAGRIENVPRLLAAIIGAVKNQLHDHGPIEEISNSLRKRIVGAIGTYNKNVDEESYWKREKEKIRRKQAKREASSDCFGSSG